MCMPMDLNNSFFTFLVSEGVRKRKGNTTQSEDHRNTERVITIEVDTLSKTKTDQKDVQKAVCFSHDASMLATGGTDGHLRVWKVSVSTHCH